MPVKRSLNKSFTAGANWMTIICAAPLATVEKGHAMAQRCGGEIQIELLGNWTLDDARDWHRIGVRQAIYHRGPPTRKPAGNSGAKPILHA